MNRTLRAAALLTAACLIFATASAGATTAVHAGTATSFGASLNSFSDIGQSFLTAVGKMKRGDTNGAEADLKALVGNPGLASAGPRLNFGVRVALAYCQQSNHEFELAYENALAAGQVEPGA